MIGHDVSSLKFCPRVLILAHKVTSTTDVNFDNAFFVFLNSLAASPQWVFVFRWTAARITMGVVKSCAQAKMGKRSAHAGDFPRMTSPSPFFPGLVPLCSALTACETSLQPNSLIGEVTEDRLFMSRQGLELAPNKRNCVDVDECKNGTALCEQKCINKDPRITGMPLAFSHS